MLEAPRGGWGIWACFNGRGGTRQPVTVVPKCSLGLVDCDGADAIPRLRTALSSLISLSAGIVAGEANRLSQRGVSNRTVTASDAVCAAEISVSVGVYRQPARRRADTLIAMSRSGDDAFWRRVSANGLWAGAGSQAAETLAENPGFDMQSWAMELREFRELLVAIGSALLARGGANPGVQSWILAFEQRNASGVCGRSRQGAQVPQRRSLAPRGSVVRGAPLQAIGDLVIALEPELGDFAATIVLQVQESDPCDGVWIPNGRQILDHGHVVAIR